jgi:pimeloyl-ACP methyl ester carboxylesterase
MATFTVGTENSTPIELYYEDLGTGYPVILVHGFPLSGASWEKQVPALLEAGFRVITYDRRGFGKSSQPSGGYDYDTFAADLHHLVTKLELDDFALVGFSMGGGEVARYSAQYGLRTVSKAVFIGAVTPFLAKAEDNPEGVPQEVFEGIKAGIRADRPSFLSGFFANFFNTDVLGETKITEQAVQANWNIAIGASPIATHAVVDTWGTDFRSDLEKLDLPILVIHGDSDRIVPIGISGAKTAEHPLVREFVTVKDGPHAVNWTHAEEVNAALISFLKS